MKKVTTLPDGYNPENSYELTQAVGFLNALSTSKFVGSVDIDVVLEIKEKQKKESLKGSVVFPNNFGDPKKVIVFCDEAQAKVAMEAGAVEAGLDELIKKVEDGTVAFDVVIAVPAVMPKIAKLGKVLGPKGLMPNPSNGTVTPNIAAAVKSYSSGKYSYKMSEQGVVRARVGKLTMNPEDIASNVKAFIQSVLVEAKKFGTNPIKKITLSPTMGKGVKVITTSIV